ncbi:hypothetical protein GOBAR_AA36986 [Gossypium barbadense]|uniref:Leucine-rich repeat-containing N-terminal plant-type domain-containing protein n=1 Tax=Gossypium barbadense TaxID=3634 RepID=A0A2P5VY04_GOSBA|nr:hypothetical protein GOBAR_AA36986 [Gossypium barbadense]
MGTPKLVMEITSFYRCFMVLLIYFGCQGCLEEERAALLQIKDSMNISESSGFSNWYGEECCDWDGVECDPSRTRIHKILFYQLRDQRNIEVEPWFPNATLFAQFKDLQLLELPGNQIGGFLSTHAFKKLKHLRKLNLRDNSIQNGSNFCWGKYLSLYNLDLSEMMSPSCSPSFKLSILSLSGCSVKKISPWMLHNITSELWLSGNNLTGPFISNFQNITSKLTLLDISDNFLHVTLLEDINLNFPELRHLDLSNNSFNGNLPIFFSDQFQTLDLLDNQFQGGIPHGMTSNMSFVYLRLSRNNLTGDLFPKNSSLPNLRWIYLNNNHLSGIFPYALTKSMELGIIDIQNNDLSGELSSYLPVLPKLKILLLPGNRFGGQIPVQVCQMRDLHVLDLSENDFSGDIPHCVDNVSSWLDSSYGGYLPVDSWNKIALTTKGSRYIFKGSILPYIRGIDVSCNRLRGKIPIQMTLLKGIHFLNVSNNLLTAFDVAFNNLSGMIPQRVQFAIFSNDSYLGNADLCGLPLSTKCNDGAEIPPV